ncbi:MAG: hypothetical protein FWH48_04135 [Oscillospiraceae bacterium]|nr:hypothetical protein [Oscillospiraceae bacterium]
MGATNAANYKKEKEILHKLAKEVAKISALPIQQKTLDEWKALNTLNPKRPMFMIDQLPWKELNRDKEMNLECEDWLTRNFEWQLRETLYRWKHMPDDRVVTDMIRVPKAIANTGFGISVEEDRIAGPEGSSADSHDYKDILKTEEDIEKIQKPKIWEDKEASNSYLEKAKDIFDGIIRTTQGTEFVWNCHVWDTITQWRGIEACMYDISDRPEFIHKIVGKMFGFFHHMVDEYEKLGLIAVGAPMAHYSGAYCDELPGYNGESEQELEKFRHSAKNSWTIGAAQLFSVVSPKLHEEFEISYQQKWYERFGLGYYGCCDPLDKKIDIVAKLPNLRKISMSPWVDMERGSEAMAGRFVFSRKPNPAFLSSEAAWSPELVRKDLIDACTIAGKHKNPCELILKDVSTIGNKPERLWEWAKIAAEVCGRERAISDYENSKNNRIY